MPQHRLDQCAKRAVLQFVEPVGPPRRLRPVLAQLVELIRRRAGGHAQRQRVLQGPRVGTGGMHADGQVMHDAQRHAGPRGLRLRRGELFIELPLQPAVKIDGGRVLGGEGGNARAVGVPHRFRPLTPVGAVLVGQRAPRGKVVQVPALPGAECGVGQLAPGRSRHAVDQLECRTFGGPGTVPVDRVQPRRPPLYTRTQFPHPSTLWQVCILRNRFHPEVERVDEAPRGRQVR